MTRDRNDSPVHVGVIGLGNWGKNLLREFVNCAGSMVQIACDADKAARDRARAQYPDVVLTSRVDDVIAAEIDAVVIATPPASHFDL